ncbi:hypothetical protein MHC_03545 [Mycoplasma haemocanis str. Illinois]|uniref:Uncharacterized protein n=1 Tax=Mycoplasma haemocanis (strain Illinois) TaxID=1111676 RepID=H6N7E7_MYCHN|nr:hypothetical protein [Mycoplasma haemocanis]AEW45569.1 hypothetical protein MHC_03545 [Mycoplasma haemocanis str. Illinois]
MSRVFFSSIAGLSAAGIGGGIYLANKGTEVKKETIRDKLIKDRYTLLDGSKSEHQSHWAKSLEKYKEEYKNQTTYTEGELKTRCIELFNKEELNYADYKVAKKYCVVPRKISERLKDIEFKSLDTSGTQQEVTEKWKKLSEEYKKKGKGDNQLDTLAASSVNDADGTSLKNSCKTVLEKEHWDDKYDSLLENAKSWCTEEGFKNLPT